MEQQLAAGLRKGKIAKFVEDDEVEAGQIIGKTPLTALAGLALQSIDEIHDVEEPAACTVSDAGPRDGNGEMALAGSGAADEDNITLFSDEGPTSEIANEDLIDRRTGEVEIVEILRQRQLGGRELVLIERACFSAISADKRSPTIRGGSCWRLMPVPITSS